MNDKDNKYIFDDDENDALEIAEYLERELDDMDAREKNRIRRNSRKARTRNATENKTERNIRQFKSKSDRTENSFEAHKSIKEKKPKKVKGSVKKPKILRYYENNKLKVLWCTLGVLIVILIAALITTNISKKDNKKDTPKAPVISEEKQTTEEATEPDTTNENQFVAEPEDSPYNKVCESFLKNTYVQWNDEELSRICDNTQNLSKDNYTYLNKYIENIENINCYVGYETEDGKILIFVTYNMKFANISTPAPAMEAVVMVKASEGDGYLIHNFEVGDEMDLYTSNVQNNQNYLDLCSNINTQLSTALESDADLKKVYDVLKGAGS